MYKLGKSKPRINQNTLSTSLLAKRINFSAVAVSAVMNPDFYPSFWIYLSRSVPLEFDRLKLNGCTVQVSRFLALEIC
jgi:hypothetical protein